MSILTPIDAAAAVGLPPPKDSAGALAGRRSSGVPTQAQGPALEALLKESRALFGKLDTHKQADLFVLLLRRLHHPSTAVAAVQKELSGPEAKRTGKITIAYNHYSKEYEIEDGRLMGEDFFSLSYALGAGTKLHLSKMKPETQDVVFMGEEPNFVYIGLEAGQTYYVHTELADDSQIQADRARREAERKEREELEEKMGGPIKEYDNEDKASCSCIEGNPCAVNYNCRDWKNRFEVAKKNGWKG